jgi:DNA-binding GntR family transcriptional regulator
MALPSKVEPIIDLLRTRIRSGEFGDKKLPPFHELITEYKTTQETMNKVIQLLQAEGHLISHGAKGIYVNNRRVRVPGMVANFYEDILRSENEPINIYIEKPKIIQASQELAEKMNIPIGTDVLRRYKKQGANQLIFRLVEAYFPISILSDSILKQIFIDPNFHIITAIKKEHKKIISHTHEELFARLPIREEQKLLGVVRGNPIIETHVTHYLEDKKTVMLYTRKIYNANLFLLSFDYSVKYWK